MPIFIGMSSNSGDRRLNLGAAIRQLQDQGFQFTQISPVVETPSGVSAADPDAWNLPYLNLAVEGNDSRDPESLLRTIKLIEQAINQSDVPRGAPCSIRMYLLLHGGAERRTRELVLPYPGLVKRVDLLGPMVAIAPRLVVPGLGRRMAVDWAAELPYQPPVWMGIVNVTPDSFSDGGAYFSPDKVMGRVDSLVAAGAQIVDLGAESTRPGARPIGADEEWSRLEPVLPVLLDRYKTDLLRPRFSLDTYHPEVARRGLELGIDIINDVSGLSSPGMVDLARSSRADFVSMHQLSVPASKSERLPRNCDPVEVVESWLLQKLEIWDRAGLDLQRIIFDPGVGFGKTAPQSLALLQHAGRFRRHGLRVLVGHSRKSFMRNLSSQSLTDRDRATLGVSLHLCSQGVDVIRVHDVGLHTATYRSWAHCQEVGAARTDIHVSC